MTFPFSVRFNRRLKAVITTDDRQKVLQFITNSISKDKADNIVAEDMSVTYKGSTSNWNTSLFKTVDGGAFTLIYKNGSWWLNYQINMRRLFVWTATLSVLAEIFGLANKLPWWIGVFAFLWLCGANWIISVVLQGGEASNIAEGIDELICGKEPLPEGDERDERLKSWF